MPTPATAESRVYAARGSVIELVSSPVMKRLRCGASLLLIALTAAACGGGRGASAGTQTTSRPCSPSGTQLRITAVGTTFDTKCLAVTAHTPFIVTLTNEDAV